MVSSIFRTTNFYHEILNRFQRTGCLHKINATGAGITSGQYVARTRIEEDRTKMEKLVENVKYDIAELERLM